jgi:hypothetical protein
VRDLEPIEVQIAVARAGERRLELLLVAVGIAGLPGGEPLGRDRRIRLRRGRVVSSGIGQLAGVGAVIEVGEQALGAVGR